MNDNVKTTSRTELEARCLEEVPLAPMDPLPMLRAVCRSLTVSGDGDYKDGATALSNALSTTLYGWISGATTSQERRFYRRMLGEAYRRGLLDGYDCPRATSAAWAALDEE